MRFGRFGKQNIEGGDEAIGLPTKRFSWHTGMAEQNIFDKRLNIMKGCSNNLKLSDEDVPQKNVTVRAK